MTWLQEMAVRYAMGGYESRVGVENMRGAYLFLLFANIVSRVYGVRLIDLGGVQETRESRVEMPHKKAVDCMNNSSQDKDDGGLVILHEAPGLTFPGQAPAEEDPFPEPLGHLNPVFRFLGGSKHKRMYSFLHETGRALFPTAFKHVRASKDFYF